MSKIRIDLPLEDIPKQWYNVLPDLPTPLDPPLHPGTKQPISPQDLTPIFPMGLIEQEVSTERWIDIPEEVIDIWAKWRPSPIFRAKALEEHLGTPAKIYYKYEGVSPPGSHKPNTAVAQAYYNKQAGMKRISTETGAGQWGSALSFACCLMGMECTVYMVKVSYGLKPYRRSMIHVYGAEVYPSPSDRTEAGRKVLAEHPDSLGSLGIAISEAVEDAAKHDDTNYALGSVLNHVILHQSVVGLESKKQLALVGDEPNIIIGCVGGGSNFGGIIVPFLPDKLAGKDIRFIGVEPTACPSMTKGKFEYDFGDVAGLTPLLMMYTLGHDFVPPGIHAGGLRYHGEAPIISRMVKDGLIEPRAYHQLPVFEAALTFARTEGLIIAPETAHAVKGVIEVANECKEAGEAKTILFNCSGHGYFDFASYDEFLAGNLVNFDD